MRQIKNTTNRTNRELIFQSFDFFDFFLVGRRWSTATLANNLVCSLQRTELPFHFVEFSSGIYCSSLTGSDYLFLPLPAEQRTFHDMIFCTYLLWRMILGIFCQNLFPFCLCVVPANLNSFVISGGSFFQPLLDERQTDTNFRSDLLQGFAFLPSGKDTFNCCTIKFLLHFPNSFLWLVEG